MGRLGGNLQHHVVSLSERDHGHGQFNVLCLENGILDLFYRRSVIHLEDDSNHDARFRPYEER